MKIIIKELNAFSREFFIEIPWSGIEKDFNKFAVDFSKKIKIPGFRPGKVPKKILMDRFQPSIEAEFVENSVNKYYSNALEQKMITPVNQGSVSEIDFKFENYFKFKVAFEIEPKIELPKFKKNTFKIEKTEYVTDDVDIDMAIDDVRMRNADIKTVENGSKVDDFIICDLQEVDISGIPIIGEKLETKYIKIGQAPFDGDNQEKLLNLKPEQKVNVKIPKDENKELANYELLVKNVERQVLPELNNDFAKIADPQAKDLADFRDRVSQQIHDAYTQKTEESITQQLCDAVINKVNPEFPESMADSYLNHMVNDVMARNQGQLEIEKVRETYKPIAEQSLKWYLIRKAIVREKSFEVTKEEVVQFIEKKKTENPQQEKEIDKFYKKPSNRERIEDNLIEKKVLAYLTEFAKIKEAKLYTKDLRNKSEVK
jgi:trigger factor